MLTEDRIKEIIAEQGYKAWLHWRPRYSALRTRDETASVYAVVARRQRYLGALHLIVLMREDELRQLIRVKCAASIAKYTEEEHGRQNETTRRLSQEIRQGSTAITQGIRQ